jgi:ParB family chromosome partitioning protein
MSRVSLHSHSVVRNFDPSRVRPLPDQPRKRFRRIQELADSIKEIGQSCPGIVTLVMDDPKFDAQLVDGERRLRACKLAGVEFRAEVREDAAAEEIFVASFAANFGKQDHDVIEIAEGLARMQKAGKTLNQLARIAGRSIGWVQMHLNLHKLHPDVRAMMISEDESGEAPLTFCIAQLLVPIAQSRQVELARKIVKAEMSTAAARRYVLRERHEDGDDRAYAPTKSTKASINRIDSILTDFSDRVGVFVDMPGAELNRLIDAADNQQKRQIIESIEDTADTLEAIADAIRSRLPKIGVKSA